MSYDPELPAGFQDADFEMRDLEAAAARDTALKARGICTHGWVQGTPGRQTGPVRCLEEGCGKVFESDEAWLDARDEALHG